MNLRIVSPHFAVGLDGRGIVPGLGRGIEGDKYDDFLGLCIIAAFVMEWLVGSTWIFYHS